MSKSESKSHRKPALFWGWGNADEHLSDEENHLIENMVRLLLPQGAVELSPPQVDEFELPESRLGELPDALAEMVSTTPYDRLLHSYGKSYPDMARMYLREVPNAPDGVAFPRTEEDIAAIYRYAAEQGVAVIPFGGGTSVCGGVEADVGDHYNATLVVDMENFNRVLSVDPVSRRARIQAGIRGPDMEAALKPHGLTLRHYPQSFPFVTLGGMVATRAGGHFATVYTHIEDMVEATRTLTPSGLIETRDLPGSGAGPSADRLICGSEGTLGIITEATLRLQQRPQWRATASVIFQSFLQGAEAVRLIAQSGLFPSNCRLLDEQEVMVNRVANRPCAVLVLGFESADHEVSHWMERALEIAREQGGELKGEVQYNGGHGDQRASEAESWRNAFIRMPYWRNRVTAFGIVADTFETAVTWDRFPEFYRTIKREMEGAIAKISGHPFSFSCRFTHVYPDGPAPYFTFYMVGDTEGNLHNAIDKWKSIKQLSLQLLADHGATATHHHAVGRDHRFGYEQQTSPLYRQALAATKQCLDPDGLLNPGVLIDPVGKEVGIRGVFSGLKSPQSP
ncbi:FAD-binding oxidoreductase [Aestuariirhabdus litorea]|uniref:FAD-binding oxidoreductase n=1 Tax=Aestuariirhabdus litorea TaxID=2528527 RepID=A0A3P3VL20_9GAMM|nr:FAD-binding oxidoreductase [Aestuariirhabdus litorea]RRJ83431.1 FAD-binding oxidoreductase [Aestuariirhabdus litorea]RWW93593.1 FAD-binding protein [Endozoicomonadaceae bacterium GTF-13]